MLCLGCGLQAVSKELGLCFLCNDLLEEMNKYYKEKEMNESFNDTARIIRTGAVEREGVLDYCHKNIRMYITTDIEKETLFPMDKRSSSIVIPASPAIPTSLNTFIQEPCPIPA